MSVINEIKTLLGMSVKLAQMQLENGTVLEADSFEMDMPVFIVNGEDRIPVPVGEYTMTDGMILKVEVEGIIASVEMAAETPNEVTPEVEVEVEANAEVAPKKIVESISKEMFFAEIEKLRNEIADLKLFKAPVLVEELSAVVEPLTHSPEIKEVKIQKFGSNRPLTTQDRVMAKIFNK